MNQQSYINFLESKKIVYQNYGINARVENTVLFEFQRYIVEIALKKGKFCVWAGCGLGKTLISLEWSYQVHKHTSKRVIILSPLSIAKQFEREANKFNYQGCKYLQKDDNQTPIVITNYERLKNFNADDFIGVVCDESSILKCFTSKTRDEIIGSFQHTPYKLSCSATPSPNDYMELGNQSEFIGALSRTEMLATFFTHDSSNTSKWRLKNHGQSDFWDWVSTWAIAFENPVELNFNDVGYDLPKLNTFYQEIDFYYLDKNNRIKVLAETLSDQRECRKQSLELRVKEVADIVNNSNEQWLVFCELNIESSMLKDSIVDCVEVKGSDKPDHKENAILDFIEGNKKVLVSKPSIVGMGMNFQHCHNIIYCSLSHSWESYYQSVRRCWRFGQENEVNVYIVYSSPEKPVLDNIQRKQDQADEMKRQLLYSMLKAYTDKYIKQSSEYNPEISIKLPAFI